MSSILDAVTKDAERSGKIPDADGPPPRDPGKGGGRFRSTAIVVVLGLLIGAGASRLLGGSDEAVDDDLLTDKVASRAKTSTPSGEGPVAPVPPADADEIAVAAKPSPDARGKARKDVAAKEDHEKPDAKGGRRGDKKDERGHGGDTAKVAAGTAPIAPAAPPMPAAAPPPIAPAAPAPVAPVVAPASVTPPAVAVAPTPAPTAAVAPVPAPVAPPVVAAPPAPIAQPTIATPPTPAPIPPAPAAGPAVAAVKKPIPPAVVPPSAPVPTPAPTLVAKTPPPSPTLAAPPVAAMPIAPPTPAAKPAAPMGVPPPNPAVVDQAFRSVVADEVAPAAPPARPLLEEKPEGAPEVFILFVAWSRKPEERLVSMRVGTGPLNVVHEGESVEGLQIATIHPESVDLVWTGRAYRVPMREF